MIVFAARRLLQAIPVLILSSIAIFLLLRLIPGDLAVVLAGTKGSPDFCIPARLALSTERRLCTVTPSRTRGWKELNACGAECAWGVARDMV